MLTKTQIKQLLTNWELGINNDININEEAGGNSLSNKTWNIDEKYIFKTGKNISGCRTHAIISNALKKQGMMAAYPIKTKDAQDYLVKDDSFYAVLNRIEGDTLPIEKIFNENTLENGYKYGQGIGKLHKVFEAAEKDIEVEEKNIYNIVISWALPETRRIMEQWGAPLPEEFFQNYINEFEKLYPQLKQQIIHRDPNPYNIIFSDGEIKGFIDFEISEKNIRIFDPCYCGTAILSNAENIDKGYEKWPQLLEGIIKGYDDICNITEAEKQAIPYIIYSIQMIFIAWASQYQQYKELALTNRKMLLWLWENRNHCFPK